MRWNQRKTAKLLKIPEDRYRAYEYDRAELPEEHAKRLAAEWGVSWQAFYEDTGPVIRSPKIALPFWGAVPAGDWAPPARDPDTEEVDARFAPERRGQVRVVFRVRGDSLDPIVRSGELLIIELEEQPTPGLIVVARNGDKEITTKVLVESATGFKLRPVNLLYSESTSDFIEQVGFAVGRERQGGPGDFAVEYSRSGLRG